MKIALLGNCQIEPLSNCLKLMGDRIEVSLQRITLESVKFNSAEIRTISESDYTISIERMRKDFVKTLPKQILDSDRFIEVPNIYFDAFHPDAVYAKNNGHWLKNGVEGDWNSGLLLYCLMQDISINRYFELLHDESFCRKLGFLNRWDLSCVNLALEFERRGFNFQQWLNLVRRRGVFMWGINHPKLIAVAALAEQILKNIGISPRFNANEVEDLLDDPLHHIVWPVLSTVASELGVQATSGHRQGALVVNLKEFAQLSAEKWRRESVQIEHIEIIGAQSNYSVLGSQK
jgi:Polysaccharide biosynthesis enzyme WcbI